MALAAADVNRRCRDRRKIDALDGAAGVMRGRRTMHVDTVANEELKGAAVIGLIERVIGAYRQPVRTSVGFRHNFDLTVGRYAKEAVAFHLRQDD